MIRSCKVRSRQAQTLWCDEQGLETVEWIAIIFAALALMLAAAVVFSAQGGDVANAALAKLAQFIAGLAGVAPGVGAAPVNPLDIAPATIATLGIPTLTADMPATAASVAALSFGGASVITWFGGAPGASGVQSTLASVVGATAPQLGPEQVTAGSSSGGLLAQVGNFFSQAGSALATAGGFVFDLGKGIVLGAKDAVVGLWEVVKWSYRISLANWLFNRKDWEQNRDQTLAVLGAIARDPGAALQAIWEGIKEPYVTAWNSGHPGEAIGRGIFDIGSLFIGVGEISAAVKGSTTVARVSSRLAAATRALNVADRLSAVGSTLRRLNPAGIVAGARRLLGGSADNVAGSLDEIGDIERTLRGALNNQVFDPEAFARTLSRLTPEQMQQIQNTLAARLDDLPQSIRQQAQAQIARTQAAYPGAQGLRMSLEPVQVDVPLDQVRYSQAWVSRATRDGTPISEIAENMRVRGWDRTKDPALMVQFEDGRIVTLDHRRLVAANQAGLRDVPALLHPERMPISADQAGRFRLRVEFTYNGRIYQPGALPTNWGEAAMFRSANQRIDVPQFPIEGNPVVPIIGRPRR
jgi:hypothetical protein